LVAASERCFKILGISRHLCGAAIAEDLIGPLARRWPRTNIGKPRFKFCLFGANKEFLVAVCPHADVTRRKEFQLFVKLPEISSSFLNATKLFPNLLWLTHHHTFDIFITWLLAMANDRDVDGLLPLASGRQTVPDLDVGTVEAIALQKLAHDLLNQSVLWRGRDRQA
jgi:hypothetical protein